MDKPQASGFVQPANDNQFQRPPQRNYNQPRNNDNQFQREPPRNYNQPRFNDNQPRFNDNQFQRDGPPPRTYNNPPNNNGNQFQRDAPPHQNMEPPRPYGFPPGQPPQGQELYCFGCGKNGHRMPQCGELNALLNQRVVIRNNWGRLQWPDGSPIQKDRDDSWVQAIGKNIKRTNIVQAGVYSSDEEDEEVNHYVGVVREEDDASTDEQEDLGWLPLPDQDLPSFPPRQVGDCYALGVERSPRISRDTRRQVQFHPPGKMQGMKDFPERGNAMSHHRQGPPIDNSSNNNRYQSGTPKRVTVRTDLANRPTEPMLVSLRARYTKLRGNRGFLQSGSRQTTPVRVGVTCGSGISAVRVDRE